MNYFLAVDRLTSNSTFPFSIKNMSLLSKVFYIKISYSGVQFSSWINERVFEISFSEKFLLKIGESFKINLLASIKRLYLRLTDN